MSKPSPIAITDDPAGLTARKAAIEPADLPLPVTTLASGIRIGQIDAGDAIAECWRRLLVCEALVIINRPGMKLPPSVLEDIFAVDTDTQSLRFDVRVNEAKQTTLRYVRYTCPTGMMARLRILFTHVLLRATSHVDGVIGKHRKKRVTLYSRILRRLSLSLKKLVDRAQVGLLAPKPAVLNKLNGYVLTNRFDDLPEFSFPAALHVALTKNCNLSCVMCPYHSEDLKRQHTTNYFASAERLPEALFARLIEEAGRHGAHLSFGQYDEPFIYKNFARWAVRAKEAGCSVSITTNGTLLDEKAAELLVSAGIDQISFSLDAATQETYRAIRLDDFEQPLRNLRKLVAVRNRVCGHTKLRACLVVQEQNRHEQEAFYDLIDGLGLDMVSFYNLSVYKEPESVVIKAETSLRAIRHEFSA